MDPKPELCRYLLVNKERVLLQLLEIWETSTNDKTKLRATELLGKELGMFTDKLTISSTETPTEQMEQELLRYKEQQAAKLKAQLDE